MSSYTQTPVSVAQIVPRRQEMPSHCTGEPTITPFRFSSYGSAYAVLVCCCGETMQYVELERGEGSE